MADKKNFFERVRLLDKLTPSEKKIVAFFESQYPLTAFETISTISEKASVGKATISRFIGRLGYAKFSEFIESMQDEMIHRLESPIERYSLKRERMTYKKEDQLDLHISYAINNLQETHQRINNNDFCRAAEFMANCKGRLFVSGAATSQALADYFHFFMFLLHYLLDIG